jgi:hypothetical protein
MTSYWNRRSTPSKNHAPKPLWITCVFNFFLERNPSCFRRLISVDNLPFVLALTRASQRSKVVSRSLMKGWMERPAAIR